MFISTNDCDGKAVCIENCPTKAIRMVGGKAFSCITCGACADACPNNAIFNNNYGGYVVDRTKCNSCGVCLYTCPVNSIHLDDDVIMGICSRCGVCVESCPIDARVDGFDLVKDRQLDLISSFNEFNLRFNDIPSKKEEKEKTVVTRSAVTTNHEDCILCGRCQFYCPTHAIDVNLDSNGKCTSCRICSDVCPVDAITKGVVDNEKCTRCFKCLKSCPNDAISVVDSHVFINLPSEDENYKERGSIVSCLNCGLCIHEMKGDSLSRDDVKIAFNPELFTEGDADKAVETCPVSTLKELEGSRINLEGYCVLCGKCVEACNYFNARSFTTFEWNGDVSDDCISCGLCVEKCPKDALTLDRGKVKLDSSKCILCETCAIHCPKDAIPTTTMRKKSIVGGFNYIDNRLCMRCSLCENICPEEAVVRSGDDLVIDENKCIYCGACYNVCPARAILFQREIMTSL